MGVSHPPVSRRSVGNTSKQPYFHLSACRRSSRAGIQSAIQGEWVFTRRIEDCAKPKAPGVSQAALKEDNPFWLFLIMTHDAYRTTCDLEPALQQRFADGVLEIEPLQHDDITALIRSRLDAARPQTPESPPRTRLFPFPDDLPFSPATRANPRRLVKVCSSSISAADATTPVPFTTAYLRDIEARLFSTGSHGTQDARGS